VPGAFSSRGGEDFRCVLEETARVKDQDAVIPGPADGKWRNAGVILGDGWSIAWRVLDAQFWGVPQRRRRIALVADFGGHSASEILFVRKSLSGYSDESKPKRKETASNASRGIGADDRLGADQYNAVILGDTVSTLGVNCGMSHGRQCVLEPRGGVVFNANLTGDKVISLVAAGNNSTGYSPKVMTPITTAYTLRERAGCAGGGNVPMVLALDRASFNQVKNAQFDFEVTDKGINSPLVAKGPGAVCYTVDQGGGKSACNVAEGQAPTLTCTHGGEPAVCYSNKVRTRYIVRRLTPMECERLQGYPDGWTDIGEYTDTNGKKRQTSDAARYKALGNSIALPPWKWVLKRICACYERDATMASLFDGIGGFPYLWEQLNGKGTCLWASEIEEFPIAVTKARIGE
jgi:DNA (cytosine-5)-methyltransferase 1